MKDKFGRTIKYLRLSVTDLCNYRCIYCMDKDGVVKKRHNDILSIEELTDIAKAAYSLGISKIRLTGGEPLVRRGVVTLCKNIRAISDDIGLGITTNGSLLPNLADELKKAGVDRLNISLDTLDKDTFRSITRVGELDDTLNGIKAAKKAGFTDIKINTVLLGGINDGEIFDFIKLTEDEALHVRFIELMPLGVVKGWDKSRMITVGSIEEYLQPISDSITSDGVARVYHLPGHKGTVGLISPMSKGFCASCDKIRVTADGKLKPCLHSQNEINLRGLHGDELISALAEGISQKPERHMLDTVGAQTDRNMNEIGG